MNTKEEAALKIDAAMNQLLAGEIDWEQLEAIIEEATEYSGPRPRVTVEITLGGEPLTSFTISEGSAE